jgi:hypothetical protein
VQPLSITTFFRIAPAPIRTSGNTTASSRKAPSLTRTLENSTECLTVAPLMMQPPETIESTAMPRRFSSSKTNLAGGNCS